MAYLFECELPFVFSATASPPSCAGQLQDKVSFQTLEGLLSDFDGGFKMESVTTKDGKALKTVTNYTMMRIDLPTPLRPGQSFAFNVKWHYNINDETKMGIRSGYEYFPEDKNYLYEIA